MTLLATEAQFGAAPARPDRGRRVLVPLEGSDPARTCRHCGRRPARFVLRTTVEMGGRYRGTGRTKTNSTDRCALCVKAVAEKFGLDVPEAC